MVFSRLFRCLTRGRRMPRGGRTPQPRSFVPELSALEDRSLPSVVPAVPAPVLPANANAAVTTVKVADPLSNGQPALAKAATANDTHVVPFKVNGGGTAPEGIPVFPGGTASHNATGNGTHLGKYSGNEGNFQLLSINLANLTGTFRGSFVFVAANGDRLFCNYGADPSNPGTFSVTPTADGKVVARFVAVFTPVPELSTGRFAKVVGGSFTMIATTAPFALTISPQGYTPAFQYTWEGVGTFIFANGKK